MVENSSNLCHGTELAQALLLPRRRTCTPGYFLAFLVIIRVAFLKLTAIANWSLLKRRHFISGLLQGETTRLLQITRRHCLGLSTGMTSGSIVGLFFFSLLFLFTIWSKWKRITLCGMSEISLQRDNTFTFWVNLFWREQKRQSNCSKMGSKATYLQVAFYPPRCLQDQIQLRFSRDHCNTCLR